MNPSDVSGLFSPAVVMNTLLLVLVLGAGIATIVAVRRQLRPTSARRPEEAGEFPRATAIAGKTGMTGMTRTTGTMGMTGMTGPSGDGGWETTLAGYKNLRDQGVLSEEEYRKIKILVDPRGRTGVPELRPQHRPPTDPAGPSRTRD